MEAPNFMQSPLVVWIQTFSAELITYHDLCDGIFLSEVMQQIDSKTNLDGIVNQADDRKDRLHNWEILMTNIYAFYKDMLQQYVVLQPPDINIICSHPDSESSHAELERVLLLVLGCAVQSDNKAVLIENIKTLDTDVQRAIVHNIQTITDSGQSVCPVIVSADELDETALNMYNHLCYLLSQRDSYIRVIKELNDKVQESTDIDDALMTSVIAETTPTHDYSDTKQQRSHRAGVELAQSNAKLRRLRHEFEDKCEALEELQLELETMKQTEQRMRLENRELLEEARTAKFYRDELDIVKDKAERAEKYEMEATRLKEKLHELEFYRARVDELRADNSALIDSNQQLSDQLTTCRQRIEAIADLENELLVHKQKLATFSKEKDEDQQRIVELMRENTRLEFDRKLTAGEDCSVDDHMKRAFSTASELYPSLMDQLSDTTNSQLLRLQLENQSMRRQLEEIQENSVIENSTKMVELENENERLSAKVDKLLTDFGVSEKKNAELERTIDKQAQVQKNMEDTIEIVRESAERKVKEFEKEKTMLLENVETMRERIEKTGDLRLSDVENENKRLVENTKSYVDQIAQLEYKNKQLEKSCEKSSEVVAQFRQVEETNDRYRRENDELQRNISILKISCQQAETVQDDAAKMQVENVRLQKTVELLQQNATKKEAVEKENINLTVEIQQLKRNLELLKVTSTQLAEVEHEKEELQSVVRKAQEDVAAKATALELLENKLQITGEKNVNLEEKVKTLSQNVQELQEQFEVVSTQNKKMVAMTEERKQIERKLESLDVFSKEMEVENRRLLKERQALEKESRKMKQAVDAKDTEVDELRTKLFELENANKGLNRTMERCKELESCIQELEQENLELNQKMKMDHKILSTLRQDLVNEKVRTQQLVDEVDRLSKENEAELSQSSNVERAVAESKFRQREMKVEENFQKKLAEREEQVTQIQQSLEESRNENRKLISELDAMKTNSANTRDRTLYVTQRYSHASQSVHSQSLSTSTASALSSAAAEHQDDVRTLKNQLNSAEKQISKLQEEARTIKEANASLQSRLNSDEDWRCQFLSVQSKFSTVQLQYNDLQSKLLQCKSRMPHCLRRMRRSCRSILNCK